MRAVKRSLKHIGEPDLGLSEKEQLLHTRECLLNIGNHISEVLSELNDPEKIKEWRRYILILVFRWQYYKLQKVVFIGLAFSH